MAGRRRVWEKAGYGSHGVRPRHRGTPVDKSGKFVDEFPPVALSYAYELRHNEQILATGHVTTDTEVEVGDELRLAGLAGRVREVIWAAGEPRLLLEPSRSVTPEN